MCKVDDIALQAIAGNILSVSTSDAHDPNGISAALEEEAGGYNTQRPLLERLGSLFRKVLAGNTQTRQSLDSSHGDSRCCCHVCSLLFAYVFSSAKTSSLGIRPKPAFSASDRAFSLLW